MPLKINELVIQVKVCQNDKLLEEHNNPTASFLSNTTEQEKLALAKDFLSLLEHKETR